MVPKRRKLTGTLERLMSEDLGGIERYVDEPVVDGSFIEKDLGIGSRTRRSYRVKGIIPPPDANLLGRDVWRLGTYRKFKADLLAGKFALLRRPPHLRKAATK
jgi:hypothetical protein